MKYLFLGALLLTLPAVAQDCKYEINKVDSFSKKEVLLTRSSKLVSGYDYNLSLSVGAENKEPYLLLSANYKHSAVVGSVDPSFFILLKDENILEFTSTTVEGLGVLNIIYPISIENLKKIKEVGFNKIKFASVRFSEEYAIKKVDKKLEQNIQCILDAISK